MADILFKEECYKIIGSCFKVYNTLGCGFLEAVYQEALERQFIIDGVKYEREKVIKIKYNNEYLSQTYRADFICYDSIILELKATKDLNSGMEMQIQNYLRATNMKLGLLLNFGASPLYYRRIVNGHYHSLVS
jgi:GxxExxY protein